MRKTARERQTERQERGCPMNEANCKEVSASQREGEGVSESEQEREKENVFSGAGLPLSSITTFSGRVRRFAARLTETAIVLEKAGENSEANLRGHSNSQQHHIEREGLPFTSGRT